MIARLARAWRMIVSVALLALAVAAYGRGVHDGRAALKAALDAATVEKQAAQSEATKALSVAEQARRRLSTQLEDAANAHPVTAAACLPAERVRRLSLR